MRRSTPFRSAFLRAPLMRAVLPFMIGLLLGRAVAVPLIVAVIMVLVLLSGWNWIAFRRTTYAHRWIAGAVLWPVCGALGLLWQRAHAPDVRPDHLVHCAVRPEGAVARIVEVVSHNARGLRAWAEVEAVRTAEGMHAAGGRIWLQLGTDSAQGAVHTGDRVLVRAAVDTIARVPAAGGFDLRAWAAENGAWHQCRAWAGQWRVIERGSGALTLFEGWRTAITDWLRGSALDDRERGLVKAILIGVRDELDEEQRTSFARSGTMHVLAVSGSHVGLIYASFVLGLAFLGKRRSGRLLRGAIAIVMLWTYAGLTGFTPSVLRATITFTFFSIAEMTPWRTEPLNSLFGAAGALLLWDPGMLVQLSFQLSFLAVLGIALFYRPILDAWAPTNTITRYLWSLFAVSIAAQVMTTPLALLTFHAFPVWFLPANMVIVGLVSVAVYGGTALLLFHTVPVAGAFCTAIMEALLFVLDRTSAFFAQLPGAYPAVRIDAFQCIGAYALILGAAAWLLQGWRWARTATFILSVVMLAGWGWTARGRNAQHAFTVFDQRDAVVCSRIEGRSRVVLADTLTPAVSTALDREERMMGIERSRAVQPGGRQAGPGLRILRERVWVIDQLALADVPRCLQEADGAWTLVLHARLEARVRRALRAAAEAKGWPVHDLVEAGAYVR